MSLLDKFQVPAAIADSVARYGVNPVGITIDVGNCAAEGTVSGRRVVLAGTNNYLGLTLDADCVAAAVASVRSHGTGTTGSRLANGTYDEHCRLEAELAEFFEARTAIVFTTGYQANLGMISTLAGSDDVILLDADSHASIYDGAKLSGASMYRFPHNDVDALARRLERLGVQARRSLVVVEGLYSMLGDRAPLAEICAVKDRFGACLLVDEAHSMGVLGQHGRGRAEEEGVLDRVDFTVGTFSKSLGGVGGYCVSARHDLDRLRSFVRAYMFTASSAPPVIGAARAALRAVRERPELRARLWQNAAAVQRGLRALGFAVGDEPSPVIPVPFETPQAAVDAWHQVLQHGVYVNLVVPPATPRNFSLLRCSISAAHTPDHVRRIIDSFAHVAESARVAGAAAARAAVPAGNRARGIVATEVAAAATE